MSLIRWDPYREMLSMREAMDRLLESSFGAPGWTGSEMISGGMGVPIDMWESEGNLMLSAAIPGVKPENVDITVSGDMLTIRGEVKSEEEHEQGNVRVQERHYGSFRRSVRLPPNVDTNAIEATFENGILKLKIPETEEAKAKRIEVKPQ